MAWKVYGFMEPNGYYSRSRGEVHGPLTCKRWVRDIPHRKHKVKHRVTNGSAPSGTADEYNERRSKTYALWLAARDGVVIPSGLKCRVVWSGFYSATKTRNVHHWNGTRPQKAYLKRVCAVQWGNDEERYNTRKDGRRGAYTHTEFVEVLRVEIPNWDWEPSEAVETLDLEVAA